MWRSRIAASVALLAVLAGSAACPSDSDPSVLVQKMKAGDAAQRDAAVEKLVALGPELAAVMPEIEKAVLHEDAAVRAAAVRVLATRPESGRAGLLVALGDEDAEVRTAAAAALGGAGEKAIPGLVEHLSDTDFRVAVAAEKSLVEIGAAARPALARAAVTGDADARDWALRALVELGPESAADLIAATRATDPSVRRAAIESLLMLKPTADVALETYRAGLRDPDGSVRDAAARGVQALGPDAAAAAPDLVRLLADRDNAGPASWALREIGEAAIPALADALDHEDATIRAGAAKVMASIGPAGEPAAEAATTGAPP